MDAERTIPILPCRSIDDTLTFYRALGFEVTYQQARPNTYAVVERGGIALHFFTLRDYDPANSYSSCLVQVPDIDGLYRAFADGLRAQYGRLPVAGIPRLLRLRDKTDGSRGFNLIDPGGNWIRIFQPHDATRRDAAPEAMSKLSRATAAAELLAESKGEAIAAAKLLDTALAGNDDAPVTHRVRALILRASLAITLENRPLAQRLIAEIDAIALADDDRAALADAFITIDDLRRLLAE